MMRQLLRFLAAVPVAAAFAVAVVMGAPTAASAADVDDFSFASMHADYTLSRDADGTSRVTVVERYEAVFPDIDQNHGMVRAVPTRFEGQPTSPHLVSITDGDGTPRPAETHTDGGQYRMVSRADGFVHGRQVYVFTYTLEHVTWTYGSTGADEFNWNVVGTDHAQPYGEASVALHVPADLSSALTGNSACYFGDRGSTAQCSVTTSPADGDVTISAEVPGSTGGAALAPDQAFTLSVGFAPGTFTSFDANPFASPWGWLQAAGLGVGVLGVVLAGIARRRRLADEPGRGIVVAQYTPPEGVDALHAAVFLAKTGKGIPAEVLEQAIVGSIRILEGASGFFGRSRLVAEYVTSANADDDGRMLLTALFGETPTPGAQYTFGTSDTRFSSAAQKIVTQAGRDLTARGYYRRVGAGAFLWPGLAIAVGFVATVAFGVAVIAGGSLAVFPVVAFVAAGLLLAVGLVVLIKKPTTRAGSELREHLQGLQQFISWAEADRIRMLQSPAGAERAPVDASDPRQMLHLYETLLPWAVVFGQENQWAQQLAVYYGDTTPGWYVGSGPFNAAAFATGIGSLQAASSASTGGSTGGGSAGGGGGGGSTGGV